MRRAAVVALVLVGSCHWLGVGPPYPPIGNLASADSVLNPLRRVLRASLASDRPARYRELHASTACVADNNVGNPLVWPDRSLPPTAGLPLRIAWTVTPLAPYPEGRPSYLLVSFGAPTPPVDLTPGGYLGCWLHVDPAHVYALPPTPGGIFEQQGGTLALNWTPPPSFAGTQLRCQLVTLSPGANAQGWLFSPGLEVWIGTR